MGTALSLGLKQGGLALLGVLGVQDQACANAMNPKSLALWDASQRADMFSD